MTRRRYIFAKAFKASLPILMGYGTMGIAAGVVFAATSGVRNPAVWSGLIGATCVSGTLHFMIGDWMGGAMPLWRAAAITLAVSFRYALYGFSLLGRWRDVGPLRKFFLILGLADENYALEAACRLKNRDDYVLYCTILTALDISYWTAGTTLGALVGAMLPIPRKGIEFVMAALFISILTDQIQALVRERRR